MTRRHHWAFRHFLNCYHAAAFPPLPEGIKEEIRRFIDDHANMPRDEIMTAAKAKFGSRGFFKVALDSFIYQATDQSLDWCERTPKTPSRRSSRARSEADTHLTPSASECEPQSEAQAPPTEEASMSLFLESSFIADAIDYETIDELFE